MTGISKPLGHPLPYRLVKVNIKKKYTYIYIGLSIIPSVSVNPPLLPSLFLETCTYTSFDKRVNVCRLPYGFGNGSCIKPSLVAT